MESVPQGLSTIITIIAMVLFFILGWNLVRFYKWLFHEAVFRLTGQDTHSIEYIMAHRSYREKQEDKIFQQVLDDLEREDEIRKQYQQLEEEALSQSVEPAYCRIIDGHVLTEDGEVYKIITSDVDIQTQLAEEDDNVKTAR